MRCVCVSLSRVKAMSDSGSLWPIKSVRMASAASWSSLLLRSRSLSRSTMLLRCLFLTAAPWSYKVGSLSRSASSSLREGEYDLSNVLSLYFSRIRSRLAASSSAIAASSSAGVGACVSVGAGVEVDVEEEAVEVERGRPYISKDEVGTEAGCLELSSASSGGAYIVERRV